MNPTPYEMLFLLISCGEILPEDLNDKQHPIVIGDEK
jgi:hypothetical protein